MCYEKIISINDVCDAGSAKCGDECTGGIFGIGERNARTRNKKQQ